MAHGFANLVAIIDWLSRFVLSWRLSNTMGNSFCLEALEAALDRIGRPEIFNSDQVAQFTSDAFTGRLRKEGIAINMVGRGRCIDIVFVERLWRSLKYEEVFPHAHDDMLEAKVVIDRHFDYFNCRRQHQALDYQTPEFHYCDQFHMAA